MMGGKYLFLRQFTYCKLSCRKVLYHFLGHLLLFMHPLCKHCTAQERVREGVDVAKENCSEIIEIPLFPSRGIAWNICFKRGDVGITSSLHPS